MNISQQNNRRATVLNNFFDQLPEIPDVQQGRAFAPPAPAGDAFHQAGPAVGVRKNAGRFLYTYFEP